MKKASVINFTVDLERIENGKFQKLLKLGTFESMGFNTNRWTFPIMHIKKVEEIIEDRISFDMRYIREHIVGMESVEGAKLYITKGMRVEKVEEVLQMKERVERILDRDPKARESDKWLYMKILEDLGYEIYADFGEVTNLPSWETISRIRRKFQEIGMYLPSPEVFAVRKENEQQMRKNDDWFGLEKKE